MVFFFNVFFLHGHSFTHLVHSLIYEMISTAMLYLDTYFGCYTCSSKWENYFCTNINFTAAVLGAISFHISWKFVFILYCMKIFQVFHWTYMMTYDVVNQTTFEFIQLYCDAKIATGMSKELSSALPFVALHRRNPAFFNIKSSFLSKSITKSSYDCQILALLKFCHFLAFHMKNPSVWCSRPMAALRDTDITVVLLTAAHFIQCILWQKETHE